MSISQKSRAINKKLRSEEFLSFSDTYKKRFDNLTRLFALIIFDTLYIKTV